MTHTEGVNWLSSKYKMNRSSAADYVNNLRHMLNGEVYKRTNSIIATNYFLSKIADDFSDAQKENAYQSVAKHIDYYENLTNGNLKGLRQVLNQQIEKNSTSTNTSNHSGFNNKINSKNSLKNSLKNMIQNARSAASMSGKPKKTIHKYKRVKFTSDVDFADFLEAKISSQKGLCALTDIPLQFHGTHTDRKLLCSLDRIDSNGDYEANNLQIVCQFINMWKSDYNNKECLRLIELIKSTPNRDVS